jgi:uncharacterized membrane protein
MKNMTTMLAAAAITATACGQTFQLFPDGYIREDTNADGSVILLRDFGDGTVYRWTAPNTFEPIPFTLSTNTGSQLFLSADGSVIGGTTDFAAVGFSADRAEPTGTLTNADINAFLSDFDAGELSTDRDLPSFVLDFEDVTHFLDEYYSAENDPTPRPGPAFYTTADGWTAVDQPANGSTCGMTYWGSPWGLSGDGNTLTGFMWTGLCASAVFSGERGGTTSFFLSPVDGEINANPVSARSINHDGSVIGGFFQTFSRAPGLWVDGVFTRLDEDGAYQGEILAMTPDGTIVAGKRFPVDGSGNIFDGVAVWEQDMNGDYQFMFEAGPVEQGTTSGSDGHSYVLDMNADGTIMVGAEWTGGGSGRGPRYGWIWREGIGIELAEDYITGTLGITLPNIFDPLTGFSFPMKVVAITDVSDDGRVLVGWGKPGTSQLDLPTLTFRIVIPE